MSPFSLVSSSLDAATGVAYRIVTTFDAVLHPLAGSASTAAAIVLLTVTVRLLLLPLAHAAMRGEAARARLRPRVGELRRRHRDDPARLQRELLGLYRAEGTSPLAGFGPLLVQAPVVAVVYRLFLVSGVNGHGNELLHRELLGTALGSHWLDALTAAGPFGGSGLVFLALFALLALVAEAAVRLSRRFAITPLPAHPLLRLLPYGTVVLAAFVPLAAGLYLLTSGAWTAAERALLGRGLRPAIEN